LFRKKHGKEKDMNAYYLDLYHEKYPKLHHIEQLNKNARLAILLPFVTGSYSICMQRLLQSLHWSESMMDKVLY